MDGRAGRGLGRWVIRGYYWGRGEGEGYQYFLMRMGVVNDTYNSRAICKFWAGNRQYLQLGHIVNDDDDGDDSIEPEGMRNPGSNTVGPLSSFHSGPFMHLSVWTFIPLVTLEMQKVDDYRDF